MLPGSNGFDVARALRAESDFVPILMLTARGRPEDVLAGFESGADDYLPKPFELAILMARVRGLLRRKQWLRGPVQASPVVAPPPGAADVLEFAGHRLDMRALELHANGRAYRLTVMEADLLAYLVRHAGAVVSRKTLLDDVWGLHEDTDTRAIDNFIVRLRRYLETRPGAAGADPDRSRRRLQAARAAELALPQPGVQLCPMQRLEERPTQSR